MEFEIDFNTTHFRKKGNTILWQWLWLALDESVYDILGSGSTLRSLDVETLNTTHWEISNEMRNYEVDRMAKNSKYTYFMFGFGLFITCVINVVRKWNDTGHKVVFGNIRM